MAQIWAQEKKNMGTNFLKGKRIISPSMLLQGKNFLSLAAYWSKQCTKYSRLSCCICHQGYIWIVSHSLMSLHINLSICLNDETSFPSLNEWLQNITRIVKVRNPSTCLMVYCNMFFIYIMCVCDCEGEKGMMFSQNRS